MLNLDPFDDGAWIPNTSRQGAREVFAVKPSKNSKGTSREEKAAEAFFNCLNVLDFDPSSFAWFFSNTNLAMKKRALEVLIYFVDLLCLRYDRGFEGDTEDEQEFLLKAKRVQACLDAFRDGGML